MIVLMRNNCFLFAFAFVFMGLAGCRNKGVNVADDGVTVISVDLNESEKVSMSDIISRIEIVELEGGPDSYLTRTYQLRMADGRFYIRSIETDYIYAFDSDGRFLFNTAGRKGSGHNEYMRLYDFFVDNKGGINICSGVSGLLRYDSLLNTVSSDKSINYRTMIPLSDDYLAFINSAYDSEDSLKVDFYSTATHKIVGSSSLAKKRYLQGFCIGLPNCYSINDKEILYRTTEVFNYSVFRLNADSKTITEAYRYEAGDNMMNASQFPPASDLSFEAKCDGASTRQTSLWDFDANNNFMIAILGSLNRRDLDSGKNLHLSLRSYKDGKQRLINAEMNGGKELYRIDWLDDDAIYSFVPDYIIKYLDRMVDIDLLDEHSKEILDRRNDDANAYIIKYYLRDDIFY